MRAGHTQQVEYALELTDQGRRAQQSSSQHYNSQYGGGYGYESSGGLACATGARRVTQRSWGIGELLLVGVLAYLVYLVFFKPAGPARTGGTGGGSGGSGGYGGGFGGMRVAAECCLNARPGGYGGGFGGSPGCGPGPNSGPGFWSGPPHGTHFPPLNSAQVSDWAACWDPCGTGPRTATARGLHLAAALPARRLAAVSAEWAAAAAVRCADCLPRLTAAGIASGPRTAAGFGGTRRR